MGDSTEIKDSPRSIFDLLDSADQAVFRLSGLVDCTKLLRFDEHNPTSLSGLGFAMDDYVDTIKDALAGLWKHFQKGGTK